MLDTVHQLRRVRRAALAAPVCVGVRAVLAPGAHDELRAAGAAIVVTSNTILHASHDIDLSADLARAGSNVRARYATGGTSQ